MIYNKLILALALSASFFEIAIANGGQGGGRGGNKGGNSNNNNNNNNGGGSSTASGVTGGSTGTATNGTAGSSVAAVAAVSTGAADLSLNPSAVQSGSEANGLAASGAEAGEAASATDTANFINFCVGKTLTNGLQQKGGSCNGIVMGNIPAQADMVSSIITSPAPGQNLDADTTFTVSVQISNLDPGSFTNADATYYAAPQDLNGGKIVGHTHVTIQDMGASLTPTQALDASTFAFFKGINDVGNGAGLLSANVTGGLPAGNYRVCTMASASNHQPVLMPVAQRGAQDDCTKFTVGGAGSGTSGNSTGTAAPAASSSVAAAAGGNNGGNNGGNKGGNKGGKARFAARAFIA
ncbi:MAG: Pathogenicity cluster 5 protein d [Pycnora praestabilis]|nr:MAG: Pathogenicity cluster 5 protein d [Pycnora praestabilis]